MGEEQQKKAERDFRCHCYFAPTTSMSKTLCLGNACVDGDFNHCYFAPTIYLQLQWAKLQLCQCCLCGQSSKRRWKDTFCWFTQTVCTKHIKIYFAKIVAFNIHSCNIDFRWDSSTKWLKPKLKDCLLQLVVALYWQLTVPSGLTATRNQKRQQWLWWLWKFHWIGSLEKYWIEKVILLKKSSYLWSSRPLVLLLGFCFGSWLFPARTKIR